MGEGSLNLEPVLDFENEVSENLKRLSNAAALKRFSKDWINAAAPYRYTYNFSWLGRPIIQFPNDSWALQEIIWKTKPDLIIETGIAHGGSLIFSSSILQLIGKGKVLGIDVEIRKHNLNAILKHPMSKRIKMIEGSSIDESVFNKVSDYSKNFPKKLIFLDSKHTHDHVHKELELYSQSL